MKRLTKILILRPGTTRVIGIPELCTTVRMETPDYSLSLLSAICELVLPDCRRQVISLRRQYHEGEWFERNVVPYGPQALELQLLSTFPGCFEQSVKAAQVALVSATFTCEAYATAYAIRKMKSINPRLITVVGGTDASFRPEFYLDRGAEIVLLGSAETNLPTLLRTLDKDADLSHAKNIAWRSSASGRQYSRAVGIEDMAPLSVEVSCVPALVGETSFHGEYLHEGPPPKGVSSRSVYLRTSVGCRPGNCGYCTTPSKTGGPSGFRILSSIDLGKLLHAISDNGVHTLQLIDDNFLAREDLQDGDANIFGALESMRHLGFAWEWANGLQLSRLLHGGRPRQELIDALFSPQQDDCGRTVGGYRAFVPFETALRGQRPGGYSRWSKMRGFGLEEAIAVIEAFDRANVPMLSLGVMIGFPDDTMRDIDETVEGMMAVERTIRSINRARDARGLSRMETHWDVIVYMLLPGARDFQLNRHRVLFSDDYHTAPELLNFQTAAYWPDNFSPWELTKIRAEIAREFGGLEVQDENSASTNHMYKAIR